MGQVRSTRNIRVLNSITNYQLRIWAGYLNQPVSRDMKKQLKDKAHVQGKQMVKVSIAKGSNKKNGDRASVSSKESEHVSRQIDVSTGSKFPPYEHSGSIPFFVILQNKKRVLKQNHTCRGNTSNIDSLGFLC